jgi:hypothetical protein
VPDEECPHGLDPSWCSICKQRAAAKAAPAPPPGRRPAARSAARPRATSPAAAPARPADGLAKLRKVLFHASSYGAWPAIAELGLRTARELRNASGLPHPKVARAKNVDLILESGHNVTIRDQRPMVRAKIEAHLDGISMADWLDLLDDRVFFFTRQKELTTLLGRYQETEGQDVVVFDTAKLLRAAATTEVSTVASSEPVPWTRCPCRSRATFLPITSFTGSAADIEEVTVIGGIDDVSSLVVRVIRYHPDRTTEVLVA